MKRISFICLLILLCSLPGKAQYWNNFGWNESHCKNCLWMEQSMRLNGRQAADYHDIVHRYGQRIEKEARKHYRYWDQSAKKIFNLRMDRDRKLQRVLSPSQFRLYVRFVRERPQRIHDYQGWYNNPHYPSYRPTDICHRYEDHYWHLQWDYVGGRWEDRYDDNHGRPSHSNPPSRPGHTDRQSNRSERNSRPSSNRNERNNSDNDRNNSGNDRRDRRSTNSRND